MLRFLYEHNKFILCFIYISEQNDHGNLLQARFFYSCNLAFNKASNPHFLAFLKYLKASYRPATPHMISNPLLDKEYVRVHGDLQNSISEATALGLISDGWTNTSLDGILNFIVTCPKPIFFKSINRGINRETADYIAEQWIIVIIEIGVEKVLVIVTDCAMNMRAAWKIITEKYPHISCVGCIDHALQNFMLDLMKIQGLKNIHNIGKGIVKEIKLSHVQLAALKEKQSELYGKKTKTLKVTPKTRFAYMVLTLESLMQNKSALQAVVIDRSLGVDADVRKQVLDEDQTWPNIEHAMDLLKVIAQGIKILERDDALLSEALEVFLKVKKNLDNLLYNSCEDFCSLSDLRKMEKCFQYRFEMSIKPIHFAANLLDPRFQGRNLNDTQRMQAYDYILKLAQHLQIKDDEGSLLANIGDFRDHTGFFSHEILWTAALTYKPTAWWKGLCGEQIAAPIAARILQLPCSGASAERNWSHQAGVHTDERNRLPAEKVMKLVSVKDNLNKGISKKKIPTLAEVNKFLLDGDDSAIDIDDEDEDEILQNVEEIFDNDDDTDSEFECDL